MSDHNKSGYNHVMISINNMRGNIVIGPAGVNCKQNQRVDDHVNACKRSNRILSDDEIKGLCDLIGADWKSVGKSP